MCCEEIRIGEEDEENKEARKGLRAKRGGIENGEGPRNPVSHLYLSREGEHQGKSRNG